METGSWPCCSCLGHVSQVLMSLNRGLADEILHSVFNCTFKSFWYFTRNHAGLRFLFCVIAFYRVDIILVFMPGFFKQLNVFCHESFSKLQYIFLKCWRVWIKQFYANVHFLNPEVEMFFMRLTSSFYVFWLSAYSIIFILSWHSCMFRACISVILKLSATFTCVLLL